MIIVLCHEQYLGNIKSLKDIHNWYLLKKNYRHFVGSANFLLRVILDL